MIKIIITIILICYGSVLNAQEVKNENKLAIQNKANTKMRDSIQALIDNEPDMKKKEVIYYNFIENPEAKHPFFNFFKFTLQRDFAVLYASKNKVSASNSWIARLSGDYAKADAVRLAAEAYGKAGFNAQGIKMLKPILDGLLKPSTSLNDKSINVYTKTVKVYVNILKPGAEQEIVSRLKPVYDFSGGYFPSDLSGDFRAEGANVRSQLFYVYAKALPKENFEEIAKVVNKAFRSSSVPLNKRDEVIRDFASIQGFEGALQKLRAQDLEFFKENIRKLMAKPDINNIVHQAESLKGKYFLIDFWGSWCLPCRFTHPHLREVYAKYKDKGFEIVGISYEGPKELEKATETWKKAVQEDKIEWIHLLCNENMQQFDAVKVFGVGVFPTKILVNKDGEEIARYMGGISTEFDEKMKEIFGF